MYLCAAPTATFANYQAMRGRSTAESVENTCLYPKLHGGAQHDRHAAGSRENLAQTDLAVIPSKGGGACGRRVISGICTFYISPILY